MLQQAYFEGICGFLEKLNSKIIAQLRFIRKIRESVKLICHAFYALEYNLSSSISNLEYDLPSFNLIMLAAFGQRTISVIVSFYL